MSERVSDYERLLQAEYERKAGGTERVSTGLTAPVLLFVQELNVALFWDKVNFKEYVPVCPTSAISGDGLGDLMALLVTLCQKQQLERLQFSENLECHILEVSIVCVYVL